MREEKTAFVRQMIEGDERAFDELYHSYSGKLYRMAYFITGNRSDSEDVLQETFVKCFLHRRKLKDPERFESWMYQILVRTAWKTAGKTRKAGEISYEGMLEQGEDSGFPMAERIRKDSSDLAKNPLDQILEEETSAELRQAVSQLSMKYRTVILLYSKVAEALGDGLQFSDGHVTDVDGIDEEGKRVDSYPEVYVHYQGDLDVTLSVSRPLENLPGTEAEYTLEETYQDILLQGKVDQYLFLPPSQEPSEEDRKLEEEGRLMISYGSETEQRKAFKSIAWNEDGLHYLLFSFDEIGLEELTGYAKEIIDME